ncbi:response regulator [Chryseobacterium sp. KACC 21268]|nr:response regulator [Chryseobacterium sp. KACC 21268]
MRKIYIVEDDNNIMEVLEIFLNLENFEVYSFLSIKQFGERDRNVTPDIYLFDVNLPDGSGVELCNQIKKDTKSEDIPVIIMSAHANLQTLADQCQPDELIPKPFDLDSLLSSIKSVIK